MTEKLFEQDSYCRRFTAVVESCEADGDAFRTVLNRTAFFPEGGGQSADKGSLNGVPVLDVQREDDRIFHKTASALPVGAEVAGEIDWDLRYSRMQGHTGEHILSGVIHSLFGYNNVGFHLGDPIMTVDVDGPLKPADIEKIEQECNRAIYQNADVIASYPSEEELASLHFRSKIDLQEDTRIVTIGDVDCCACCAPHLAKTGEVGILKIINFYSYKQGTRMEIVAGINAFRDYSALNNVNRNLMKILSASRGEVEAAVQEQNSAFLALKNELKQLSRRLALYELDRVTYGDAVCAMTKDLGFDELRYCANSLLESEYNTCVLLSKNEDGSINYVASSKTTDVRLITAKLNEAFCGKGGGKPNYVQGKLAAAPEREVQALAGSLLQETVSR